MPTYLLIPLLLVAGYSIGMLVNYLSDVLPAYRKLSKPACQGCLTPRTWKEFFFFQSCQSCGQKVSIRSYLVPVVFVGLTVYFYFFPAQRLGTWPILFLITYFALVLVNDLEHRVVLFQVSIAGLAICFLFGYFMHGLWSTLIGGVVGFAIMYLLYLGGGWFTKFLSRRRGEEVTEIALGFGDVSIGAVIGLLLGWPAITAGLMIGILAGGLVSGLFLLGMILLRRYQPFSALPYTPFLILGAVILLFMKG